MVTNIHTQESDKMKTIVIGTFVLVTGLVIVSCSALPHPDVAGVIGGALNSGSGVASAAPAAVDFQSGELLCSVDSGPMTESGYYVAKILTPASDATKNQAQVVFIPDGRKSWVNYAVNSRKASKADFSVGATVFYLRDSENNDNLSADTYRKDIWVLGNITSIDDLYKNRVEIGGSSFATAYLRVPTDQIK